MRIINSYQLPRDVYMKFENAEFHIPENAPIYDTSLEAVFYIRPYQFIKFKNTYCYRDEINITKILNNSTIIKLTNILKFPYMNEERQVYSICIFDNMMMIMFATEDDKNE